MIFKFKKWLEKEKFRSKELKMSKKKKFRDLKILNKSKKINKILTLKLRRD